MNVSLFIANLAIGPLLLLFAVFFRFFPPKQINMLYGFRTSRSMKSQATWQTSNKQANNLVFAVANLTTVIQTAIYISGYPMQALLWGSVIMCVLLVLIIPVVEIHLKRNFDSEGNPKAEL